MPDFIPSNINLARIRRQAYPGESEPRGMHLPDPPWTPRAMRDDVRLLLAEVVRMEQCQREGWLFAQQVEDEYRKRTGHGFGVAHETPPTLVERLGAIVRPWVGVRADLIPPSVVALVPIVNELSGTVKANETSDELEKWRKSWLSLYDQNKRLISQLPRQSIEDGAQIGRMILEAAGIDPDRVIPAEKAPTGHDYTCTSCFTEAGTAHRPGCRQIEIDARAARMKCMNCVQPEGCPAGGCRIGASLKTNDCPYCDGAGHEAQKKCVHCDGTGRASDPRDGGR